MVTYTFAPGTGNELVLDERDVQRHNPVKNHTGVGDLRATFAYNRELEAYAQRQDRVLVEWSTGAVWTGYAVDVEHDEQAGTTRLSADGIGKRLEETRPDYDGNGGPLRYQNQALEDVLRDYWPRTPFTNVSVTSQSTEQVANDQQVQSADTTSEWNDVTTIADDEPFEVSSGSLRVLQSGDTRDALDDNNGDSGLGFNDDDAFNDGQAAFYTSNGDYVEFTIQFAYRIPESNVEIQVRDRTNASSDISYKWDGTEFDRNTASGKSLGWSNIGDGIYSGGSGYSQGDIQAGTTYTLRIEANASSDYELDVVAVHDGRYTYTYPNPSASSNSGGILDGPEEYPDVAEAVLDSAPVSFNITAADVSSSWKDSNVSNNQFIRASNDDGASYEPTDGTETNTSSLSVSFSGEGRSARVKFGLSRYTSDATTIPATGDTGQAVQSYTLTVDGNNLVVVDDLELSRSHFDNLQTLHTYGDYIWVIEHDTGSLGNMVVSSFQRGDETRPAPAEFSDPIQKRPRVRAARYFNTIYLEGALEAGSRPSAELKDSTAVSNDGREISPGVLRDLTITTEAGASFRARSLLETSQRNKELTGTITIPPVMTDPGYGRTVDFGDGGATRTVEEVVLNEGPPTAESKVDFAGGGAFSEEIRELRRNAKDLENQV